MPNLLQNNNVSQMYFLPIGNISLGNFNLKKLKDQIAAGLPSFLGSLTAVSVPWSIWAFTESLEFSLSTWMGLWRVWTTSWTIAPPAWASNWWPLSSKKAFRSPASSMCLPSITVQFSYNTVLGINCSKSDHIICPSIRRHIILPREKINMNWLLKQVSYLVIDPWTLNCS